MSGGALDKKLTAKALRRVGVLLELAGENPFKSRAFDRAARAVESYEGTVETLAVEARAGRVEGIGKGIAADLEQLAAEGRLGILDDLEASFPPGLTDLLDIPGLGPKTVRKLYNELSIHNLDALENAARESKLSALPGMGAKSQQKILIGIEHLKTYAGRYHLHTADQAATSLLEALAPVCTRLEIAGSLRRRKETVKDIDLLAAGDPSAIADRLTGLSSVQRVTGRGEAKCSVVLNNGMACDVRFVDENGWGAALAHFTGSADHNVALRRRAKERGLKLNEYGLEDDAGRLRVFADEAALYEALGLAFIPPELREDAGEIEAAETGLPKLVDTADLVGVVHAHTRYSDGTASIGEMASAAGELGFRYLALADHSQSATVAGGLKPDDVRRQHDEIDAHNASAPVVRVLKGIESDIRKDGSLDYDDELLEHFDFVIASVHSHFSMSAEEMTARVIKAARNPFTTFLGHPTGRLLLRREAYGIDLDAVIEACARYGCAIEINANPYRLDLDWRYVRKAVSKGVAIVISPDAHSTQQLAFSRYGVDIARKGWATPADVLNTLSADAFLDWALAKKRRHAAD